jgi:hypothetical protein
MIRKTVIFSSQHTAKVGGRGRGTGHLVMCWKNPEPASKSLATWGCIYVNLGTADPFYLGDKIGIIFHLRAASKGCCKY